MNPSKPSAPAAITAVTPDPWAVLRTHTPARVGLGRAGHSLPTREWLAFGVAHAQARDAVHLPLDVVGLQSQLHAHGWQDSVTVRSAAPDRATYLLRPDLGRRLAPDSAQHLQAQRPAQDFDLLLVVADGLSSAAVHHQALPLLEAIRTQSPAGWRLAPLVLATQARVALGDDIGAQWQAPLVAVLIGERPGLSAPDSLGIYLTFAPKVGRHDAERNCLSNVRPEGLPHAQAARKLWWLATQARERQLTGVALKDQSDDAPELPLGRSGSTIK